MFKNRHLLFIPFVLIMALNCVQYPSGKVYVKDDKEYGKVKGTFRNRWWNYFERGLSYADGKFYQDALSDFKAAIRQRDNDQRRARTYGMHFIDYFPHRELGIAYYFLGKLELAQTELEFSLNQFPTAKAHFYIDQVRQAIIEKKAIKVPPPQIYLSAEEDKLLTRQDPVRISGWAEDPNFISEITVNGESIFIESAQERIRFSQELELSQGIHRVEVVAINLGRKINRRAIQIHVDRQGPLIGLNELAIHRQESARFMRITGTVYDEAGVEKVLINGARCDIQPGKIVPLFYELPFSETPATIVAVDRLGNKTSGIISPDMLSHLPDRQLMACLQVDCAQFVLAQKDNVPPTIELKEWYDQPTVYLDKLYLEGNVRDKSKIVSLSINNVLIWEHENSGLIGQHENRLVYFSHLIRLNEGRNKITLEAKDKFGNISTRKIIINRKIPKIFLLDARMRLSVFSFEKIGVQSLNSLILNDYLTSALVKRKRFRMIERMIFDSILLEHKISRTQLIDDQTALTLGKLMAAQLIVTGSSILNSMGLEIVARVIDTETAEIMTTIDVYSESDDLFSLKKLTEGLALKIHREFPLVDGQILNCTGSHIFTNLGQEKLRAQRRLIIYHEKTVEHAISGNYAGTDYVIDGHARVTQMDTHNSKAEIVSNERNHIDIHHRVIPQ